MTVCLAYRVPGEGAVLAADGRVLDEATSAILSDAERKYVLCGPAVALVAGTLGKMWTRLQAAPPRTYAALRAAIDEHCGDDTEWLAYDRRQDRMFVGDVTVKRTVAGIGCGAPYGLGALEAMPLARTLADARERVQTAMAIACRRNASCGGRVRVILVPRKGAVVVT